MDKQEALRFFTSTLATLEKTFTELETVMAVFYCGSIAAGTFNEYSDIDLILVCAPKDRAALFTQAPELLRSRVGLKSAVNNDGEDNEWCCLITDRYIGLDLPVLTFFDLIPSYKFARIKIIKDFERRLEIFRERSAATRTPFDQKVFTSEVMDIRNAQIYFARDFRGGQPLEVMGECTRLGETLFQWLLKIKDVPYQPPTLRDAETLLSGDELKLFLDARPRDASEASIRRAMRGLWDFTGYVIERFESATGMKIPREYDEKEYLALVEDIYAGKRF